MVSGVRADVALKLFGDDIDTLVAKGRELEKVLGQRCRAASTWRPSRSRASRSCRSKSTRTTSPATASRPQRCSTWSRSISGKHAGRSGRRAVALSAGGPAARVDARQPAGRSPTSCCWRRRSERLPLSLLADVRQVEGPKMISREWSKRRITVQCNVRGRDIGSFVAEAQQKVAGARRAAARLHDRVGRPVREHAARPAAADDRRAAGPGSDHRAAVRDLSQRDRHAVRVHQRAVGLRRRDRLACGCARCRSRFRPPSGFITLSGVSVLNSMVFVSAFRDLAARRPRRRPRPIDDGRHDAAADRDDDGAGGQRRFRADGPQHAAWAPKCSVRWPRS